MGTAEEEARPGPRSSSLAWHMAVPKYLLGHSPVVGRETDLLVSFLFSSEISSGEQTKQMLELEHWVISNITLATSLSPNGYVGKIQHSDLSQASFMQRLP